MPIKETTIIASFILFDKEHKEELKAMMESDPDLQIVLDLVFDKLHEAKDQNGNPIIHEERSEKDKVFDTIRFVEVSVDNGGPLIIYRWKRATLANLETGKNIVMFKEFGAYKLTKQKV